MITDDLGQIHTLLKRSSYYKFNIKTPVLWLFTDSSKIIDPEIFLDSLPSFNNLGIVFRYYNIKNRYKLAKKILRICRKKKFSLLIGGDPKLAKLLGANGVHYPRWIKKARPLTNSITSCSFHGYKDILRSRELNANLAFLSPIFASTSHAKTIPLGILRASFIINSLNIDCAALGGINTKNIRRFIGTNFSAIGAIDLFIK